MLTAAKLKFRPGKTILIVDDNPAVREHLREVFLGAGFALCADADNGLKALEVAAECKPDLIVLDLVMNGVDAAPKLKKLMPKTPIILFSLHASYLRPQDLISLGIADTFMKGEPLDTLLEKAHRLIGE